MSVLWFSALCILSAFAMIHLAAQALTKGGSS